MQAPRVINFNHTAMIPKPPSLGTSLPPTTPPQDLNRLACPTPSCLSHGPGPLTEYKNTQGFY